MNLKHGDKLFIYYEDDKIPRHGKYSYFGNDFGTVEGFNQYINGYIFAVQAIYNDYISCEETRIDKLDTLIYPLCFNYRQVIELYIKYLYFKYASTGNDDKITFIKTVSHKLNEAWMQVKPHLLPVLSKINSNIDINIFDEFINEIDNFDSDSFRMRYPIKKDLSSVHSKSVKLDVVGLNNKMMDLFDLFKSLDNEIDNVLIDNNYDIDFENKIKNRYITNKNEISSILRKLNNLAVQEQRSLSKMSLENTIDFIEVQPKSDECEIENDICRLSPEAAATLALVIHIGKFISDGRCKLAVDENERHKDIVKVAEITLKECESFILFDGKHSNSDMCYTILEKGYIPTSIWLSRGVQLLDSCFSR